MLARGLSARELLESLRQPLEDLSLLDLDRTVEAFADPATASARHEAKRQFLAGAMQVAFAAGALKLGAGDLAPGPAYRQ